MSKSQLENVKILLKGHYKCDCCNKNFQENDIVRLSGSKAYCESCNKNIQDTDLKYMAIGGGRLRLILDKAAFHRIKSGAYAVDYNAVVMDKMNAENPDGYFGRRLPNDGKDPINVFMHINEEHYVFEADTYCDCAVYSIYFPVYDCMGGYEPESFRKYMDRCWDIQDIIDRFTYVAGNNLYYITAGGDVEGLVTSTSLSREKTELYIQKKTGKKVNTRQELEENENNSGLDDSVTDNSTSDNSTSDNSTSNDSASDDSASDNSASDELTPDDLTPKEMLDFCKKRIIGQDEELKKAVYMVYTYMQDTLNGTLTQADNWLLTAPSGSGKTEFFRCIKKLFADYNVPIPVVQIDLSQITQTGFKGDNMDTIPQKIKAEAPDKTGECICFLDEADKKCRPAYTSKDEDVNAAIQGNLLTLIEGIELDINGKGKFDSNKTMFVLMGAFQDIRNNNRKKTNSQPKIGFMTEQGKDDVVTTNDASDSFYGDLNIQDIINYGMQEELAGRLMQVVNFKRLSKENMRKVIVNKAESVSEGINIDIHLTKEAVEEFLAIAYGSLGVRRPMNQIKQLALNTVSSVFFEDGFDRNSDIIVISGIDKAHIKKGGKKDKTDEE